MSERIGLGPLKDDRRRTGSYRTGFGCGPGKRARTRFWAALLLCTFLTPLTLAAQDLIGTVVDPDGQPVAGAWVRVVGLRQQAVTDKGGRFSLPVRPPVSLRVERDGFVEARVEINAVQEALRIELANADILINDEIAVQAVRSKDGFSPESTASSVVVPGDTANAPTSVTELIAGSPGVSENGQGGLFQTYSVRGVSRQRVLTLVEGMRIVGERRAGVSASFIDPLLLGSVDVVRGPASTYWGSGALGGVVQLFPRRFARTSVVTGYSTGGDERFLRAGSGRESGAGGWNWGLALREAKPDETPGGRELNSGFRQASTVLSRTWSSRGTTYDALFLASQGDDIGKSSTDFPDRITTYPRERHGLFRLAASRPSGWQFDIYAHPNGLETRVETPGVGASEVTNQAFDWGIDLEREQQFSERRTLRWGVDLFARRDVSSRELVRDPAGRLLLDQETLSNASERELGVYGAVEASLGPAGEVKLLAGGRLARQDQSNAGDARTHDSAVTGFLGVRVPLGPSYTLTANIGTGLRFPSVSERFFTGTTGRGFVSGNANLDPESSRSFDLGMSWVGGSRLWGTVSWFRTDIDDYIERVEVAPEQLTFVNLPSGRIEGAEVELAWQVASSWSLDVGGHALTGEDSTGGALADIPADRAYTNLLFEQDPWTLRVRWEHRFARSEIGSGEKPIHEADLVSASAIWRWRPDISLRVSAENLLDEAYFNSADRKVPLSPGRAVTLSMEWHPGE